MYTYYDEEQWPLAHSEDLNQRQRREVRRKRKADNQLKGQPQKKKVPAKKKVSRIPKDASSDDSHEAHMDIDSGDESDGRNALRGVETREEPRAARRGPGNASMQHFHEPTAIVDSRSGQKRWEFRCRFCAWCVIWLNPVPLLLYSKLRQCSQQVKTVHAASQEPLMA
jgi:hypothetical protein